MGERDRVQEFFSTRAAEGAYDATIELVVPYYQLLHETIIRLLQNHLKSGKFPTLVYDVGSGTGQSTIRVLRALPEAHVVAIDFCPEMHTVLRDNYMRQFGSRNDFAKRCTAVEMDFVDESLSIEELSSAVPSRYRTSPPRVVVSTFTFHHFDHDEKRRAYEYAYELLGPGGVLINGDLFSYQSADMSRQARSFDLEWISQQFAHPPSDCRDAQLIPVEQRRDLAAHWKDHYLSHNCLDPLHVSNSALDGCSGQSEMLADIGFVDVEVPFRFWQTGVLCAKRADP